MTGSLKTQRRSALRSFSLLEMILVMALVGGLVVLVMGGYSATMQSTAVTTGADMLCDALTEGRADAVAQNTTVEVRIYDLPSQPAATPAYDALQLHWWKSNQNTPPVAIATLLPAWIVIDPTSAYSPLIASNLQVATPDPTDARLNSNTRVFHFLADGSTDLNPATNWFMTVRPATLSEPTTLPPNWACVAINATTGRAQIYRP